MISRTRFGHSSSAIVSVLILLVIPWPKAQAADRWWSDAADKALSQSGTNRTELVRALNEVPAGRRDGMQFLVEHMPLIDSQTLKASFLLENVALTYDRFEKAPWAKSIPKEIFLNNVLPYASLNERRDNWRPRLIDLCQGMVTNCATPSAAAEALNRQLYKATKVRYSTERKRADQGPFESMASGMATCTGLSILLVDACRAMGVPARVAATPMWTNLRGNHTWVEVWDNGWHFTGACEPDPKGLDRGWFVGDASKAQKDIPRHAIYASSFARTGLSFPMVWAREIAWVSAENVTDRYAAKASTNASTKANANANTNLASIANPNLWTAQASYSPPKATKALSENESRELRSAVAEYFAAETNRQADWKFPPSLDQLLAENEPAVRQAVWETFKAATIPLHQAARADYETNQVRFSKYLSPYTVRNVGTRPTNGWALFIAMHGGGGAPKAVNDSQWAVMQRYYKDHPEAGGYRYIALRAPNDTWNGFYDTYVYPLVANLIRQFLVFGDVDPNKVFIMGYSHGGYGAYAIGPKMPDRFAAIHASASAATDGETTAKTLRNTIFTAMVGERDTMYGRFERNQKFQHAVEALRGTRTDIYPVQVEVIAGNGHTGLPDRDRIKVMYPAVRNPVPRELTWLQTDKVITDFFWLNSATPAKKQEIEAVCRDNKVTVTTSTNVTSITVLTDHRLVDFTKPVAFEVNGRASSEKLQPSLRVLCETLLQRGDPELAFTARAAFAWTSAEKAP